MASYKNITKDQVLEAINGSVGITLTVANRLNCTWATAKSLIERWEETREAFQSETEKILDLAEGQVFKAVQAGDIATAKWVLARKGRQRGYDESAILVNNREPLNINITGEMMSQEQLQNSSGVEIPKYEADGPEQE